MLLAAALRKHLLGAAPGPDEFAAALRYLSHTGYDPLLLAGDLRVMPRPRRRRMGRSPNMRINLTRPTASVVTWSRRAHT